MSWNVRSNDTEVTMSRIPLDHPATPLTRAAEWYSRRTYGAVLDPGLALLHNRAVLATTALAEAGVARWRRLDPTLKALAVMVASARVGCSWCMDFGYWEFHHRGVDPAKLRDVPRWRDSGVYTALERRVLEYAEAMTDTPPAVTDEMVESLRQQLSDAELVELTAIVAVENQRSRLNAALGLTSQGFRATCEVPA